MNEHDDGPTRSWDDDPLTRQLRGLVRADAAAPEHGPAAAIRTVRRRVVTRVAGTAALVAALAVGVPFGVSLGSTDAAPLLVATQEPSPTASEPDMPTVPEPSVPSSEPSPAPSAEVVTAEPTSDPPPAPEPTPEAPAPPAREVLRVEATTSGPATGGDLAGLALVPASDLVDVDAGAPGSWAMAGCGAPGGPADEGRTGWAAQDVYGGDSGYSLAVAGYADEQTAALAVSDLATRAATCFGGSVDGIDRGEWVWRERSMSDSGFVGTSRWYEPAGETELAALDDPTSPGYGLHVLRPGRFVVVVREGRFVSLSVMNADYDGGSAIAVAEGVTDPGAGTYPADATEPAAQFVDRVLQETRDRALGAVRAAAAHTG